MGKHSKEKHIAFYMKVSAIPRCLLIIEYAEVQQIKSVER